MLKYLFLIFFLLISTTLKAQNLSSEEKNKIETRLDEYMDLISAGDYEAMMEYVYPKVFTIANKKDMIAMFSGIGTGLEFKFDNPDLKWIEGIHSDNYALIRYSMEMGLRLVSDETRTESMFNTMKIAFESQFGAENVETQKDDFSLKVNAGKYIVAINEEIYSNWFFIEFDESNPAFLSMLLSEELINSVKTRIAKE
ncbi:MAG: hypothetical protein ROO71_11070 [Balneola sp.]